MSWLTLASSVCMFLMAVLSSLISLYRCKRHELTTGQHHMNLTPWNCELRRRRRCPKMVCLAAICEAEIQVSCQQNLCTITSLTLRWISWFSPTTPTCESSNRSESSYYSSPTHQL